MRDSFFTGTTLENAISIVKDGKISTTPPHRVWKEYSEDFVYLIPNDTQDENGESFRYAREQSDFAVAYLGHTRRVIIEVIHIKPSLLEEDKDSVVIGGRKYSEDISTNKILFIYVESKKQPRKIKEFVAISDFYTQSSKEKVNCIMVKNMIENFYTKKEIFDQLNIPNIQTVKLNILGNEKDLQSRYYDLLEELDDGIFKKYTIEQFTKKFIK